MLFTQDIIPDQQARLLNPLQLAYVGDTVWEMLVRTRLIHKGLNVHGMHRAAIAQVNAGAQAAALDRVMDKLNQEEETLVRRGRNAHSHHSAPRNQTPADYGNATGLETLLGYLYLTGQFDRLQELFRFTQDEGV